VSVTHRPSIIDEVELATLDALLLQRKQEVRQSPPARSDVAEMIAFISTAATRERDNGSKGKAPDEREAIELCLQAVLRFLMKQPGLMERGDYQPLMRLNAALCDLKVGKSSELFEPAKKPKGGHPGGGITYDHLKGIAAQALSRLIEAGDDKKEAAERVARSCPKNMGKVNAKKVINWRALLMMGVGPGASEIAVQSFLDPVPGSTPRAQGELILKILAKRGRLIGG
jgi:hypothetical protein